MLNIDKKLISYTSALLELPVEHYVLTAHTKPKLMLLSVPNLYLYEQTRQSEQTSRRYAGVIAMFYRFLSTRQKYKSLSPGDYHVITTNLDIQLWQMERQSVRVSKDSDHPTTATTFEDAKIVQAFFAWVVKSGFTTNVKIHLETWVANFKQDRVLTYVKRRARVRIDSDPIRVLDRRAHQKRPKSLITNKDIKTLLKTYPDKVYAVLFNFALATAIRPMELCQFPYLGKGKNRHILPYSELPKDQGAFEYEILGKGKKLRTIKIPAYALKDIYDTYTSSEYPARKKKYKAKYGKACPPSILFLNAEGDPVDESMIASATNYACGIAHKRDPTFRKSNNFYQSRHWWPTVMMAQHHGKKLLTPAADVIDAAFVQVLTNQMGHSDPITTYKHYLDLARSLVMAKGGHVHEIITEDFNINAQLEVFG
ncbi:hypothetical protein [Pseudomonas sp. PP3]|uniref:hypothetical protein n=1 Tax=Pseudomonas sp. PP3 TaxID=2815936 RepID=UPI001BB08BF5|nr:hypothetical protein [Pseudomonas sp. PP3]